MSPAADAHGAPDRGRPFVPLDFDVPTSLTTPDFVLEPLGPEHNEADHAAWTSSVDHIRSTPGFAGRSWPTEDLTLDENLADLEMHAAHFRDRVGFTYTVREPGPDGNVIGCVYIYPPDHAGNEEAASGPDAEVRSWVRADRTELDGPVAEAVATWLRDAWPFSSVDHVGRDIPGSHP